MLPVFYDSRQSIPIEDFQSLSPSAAKPALVVEHWRKNFAIDIKPVVPVEDYQLKRVHHKDFVDGILKGELNNGFGNRSKVLAESLRWTNGSCLSAAHHVIDTRGGVACSPTSGFHHAHYDLAYGFCTFNGLMVAAAQLLCDGCHKIGILDYDMHEGDGVRDIIRRNEWSHEVVYQCFADKCDPKLKRSSRPFDPEIWLDFELEAQVQKLEDCEIIFYQAGADPYIHDPWGGVLTEEQLARRDERVFSLVLGMGVPLVWNLAGGYAKDEQGTFQPVLDIHENTLKACLKEYF